MVTSSTSLPRRTELEELVHSLRNIAFAMQCGLKTLEGMGGATGTAGYEEFKATHARMAAQVQLLKDAVVQCDRIVDQERAQNRLPHNGGGMRSGL